MLRCEQIARAYGIPIFQKDGIEADDLIAALARRLRTAHPDLPSACHARACRGRDAHGSSFRSIDSH